MGKCKKTGVLHMSIVNIDEDAYSAIVAELAVKKRPLSVRIEIRSTGCCDPSLGLRADEIRAADLVDDIRGLKILIDADVHALVGEVSISHVDELARKGFVLTSRKPLNEWSGFGVSNIEL